MSSKRDLIFQEVDGLTQGIAGDDQQLTGTRIQPSGSYSLGLAELWEFRELVFFFAWRELKIRYKQSILGVSWAIIQPFLTMVIFALFFGRLAKIPSEGLPYPLFCFAALVPWTLFANSLVHGSNILVLNANMIKKIYFPRLALPVATILSGLVDFLLAFVMLLLMQVYYRIPLNAQSLYCPVFLVLTLITSSGVVLWLSSMNAKFRDVRYAVPFLAQVWLFSTPIAYPSTLLSERWRILYGLNPMVSVAEGFRWSLFGKEVVSGPMVLLSFAVALGLLVSGAIYFKRTERILADVL